MGRNKKEIFVFLKGRILQRIQSWNHKFLSNVGKEVLLKSVIQALPSYAIGVFLMPKELVK